MGTWSHSKTVRGSLAIIFCIFKQIGYHMSRALNLPSCDSLTVVRTMRWHTV